MVREYIDTRNVQMSSVNAVRSINSEFLRPKSLDVRRDLTRPVCGNVFVAEGRAAELIAGFVGEDCGVFGVGELCESAQVKLEEE